MSRINVTCVVQSLDYPEKSNITVRDNDGDGDCVIIEVGAEQRTVEASALIKALQNASNTNAKQ